MTTTDGVQYPKASMAWYLLGILVVANILSYVDRQILSLLVQPLKHDLGISDTEVSLLQGFAFTILYSFLGLPLGRFADSHNRRNLIVVGVSIWSVMTVACGFAQTYGQLFAARIGVGIGEATLAPAAYSMICDAFSSRRRGTALGVYSSAIYMGIGVSVTLGGLVLALIRGAAEVNLPLIGLVRSWQAAFICVGAPGLLMALLMLTVGEPARAGARPTAETQSFAVTWAYLKLHRVAFTLQLLGYALTAMAAYGLGSWMPTFFIRIHHWPAAQAGISYGLAVTVLGTLGGILGGYLGDRWLAAGRKDARLSLSAMACVLWMPVILVGTQLGNAWLALAFMGLSSGLSSFVNGLGPTTLHDIVPNHLRGQATALFFFIINLLGLGVGPTAIAMVTDRVGYEGAIGLSIPVVAIPAIALGMSLLWLARKHYLKTAASLTLPMVDGQEGASRVAAVAAR